MTGGNGGPPRLAPDMASRRLLVLRFVREYFARWGHSPSQREIAFGLEVPRTTVRHALRSLVGDGLLMRVPGERGLMLPDERDVAIQKLRALGYRVSRTGEDIMGGGPLSTLLPPPELDYPDGDPDGLGS